MLRFAEKLRSFPQVELGLAKGLTGMDTRVRLREEGRAEQKSRTGAYGPGRTIEGELHLVPLAHCWRSWGHWGPAESQSSKAPRGEGRQGRRRSEKPAAGEVLRRQGGQCLKCTE